jgi:hypothetical protein
MNTDATSLCTTPTLASCRLSPSTSPPPQKKEGAPHFEKRGQHSSSYFSLPHEPSTTLGPVMVAGAPQVRQQARINLQADAAACQHTASSSKGSSSSTFCTLGSAAVAGGMPCAAASTRRTCHSRSGERCPQAQQQQQQGLLGPTHKAPNEGAAAGVVCHVRHSHRGHVCTFTAQCTLALQLPHTLW